MKENNIANLATNKNVFQLKLEETQKLLEDQHLSDLQVWTITLLIWSNHSALLLSARQKEAKKNTADESAQLHHRCQKKTGYFSCPFPIFLSAASFSMHLNYIYALWMLFSDKHKKCLKV